MKTVDVHIFHVHLLRYEVSYRQICDEDCPRIIMSIMMGNDSIGSLACEPKKKAVYSVNFFPTVVPKS